MKIKIIAVGKTHKSFLVDGEKEYEGRLKHYIKLEQVVIPDIKNAKNKTEEQLKIEEGQMILQHVEKGGILVLLDEKGKQYSSVEFSKWLQNKMNQGVRHITFVVGGPYGFSDEVYEAAQEKLSLSKMTFSHQMIRMLFLEQLYRGFSILKGEPYHHE
ncbi:23S rRNA (pseudouridine(1915)-N(3))-methyltransferase RlmH [Paracrocinitomix mangrovi]|uniref:23S rRNA (pseudouridine(1915)-N(3))-methyltransferase RlmH n=1 Tax=Paracrocinitomix mangrovi TaxID=2862509 RepID=UPI001C8E0360|nr:23S rRNA (pseudouridine(1915)-N(3))-methyltransferase RlmH [Paracrocinitomix mangrovi]UKN01231.1 23S rRNA (pseudouridine(1915)-N(3))-methyltransferase RlmH [Paracrocinitomix mangrovi]